MPVCVWTENTGSLTHGAGERCFCLFLQSSSPLHSQQDHCIPCWAIEFPIPQPVDANRHLIVVRGRREEGKRQSATHGNGEGTRLRTLAQVMHLRQWSQMLQGRDGQEIWPQESLKRHQKGKAGSVKKAPCRTRGTKTGRRLVQVCKVIKHLLISDIAFRFLWTPRGISGLRTAVHHCNWEPMGKATQPDALRVGASNCAFAAQRALSGWSQAALHVTLQSWAALLQIPTQITCYSLLASTLLCFGRSSQAQPAWEGLFFLLERCRFFRKECEKTPLSSQRRRVWKER